MPLNVNKFQVIAGGIRKPSRMSDSNWTKFKQISGPFHNASLYSQVNNTIVGYIPFYTDYHQTNWAGDWTTNFYDGVKVAIMWHVATNEANSYYYDWAKALADSYIDNYLLTGSPPYYQPVAHYSMIEGLALLGLYDGNTKYTTAVAGLVNFFQLGYWWDITNTGGGDGRQVEKAITAQLVGHITGFVSGNTYNCGARANDYVSGVLTYFPNANGSYTTDITDPSWPQKGFMNGMLNKGLILYDETLGPNTAVKTMVKNNIDWMTTNMYVSGANGFMYMSYTWNTPWDGTLEPNNAVDYTGLGNLIAPGLLYVYRNTGNTSYRDTANAVVHQSFLDAYKYFSKQYNENFCYGFNNLYYLFPR